MLNLLQYCNEIKMSATYEFTLKNILITSKYLPVYNSISVKQNEKNTAKVYSAFTEQLLEINNNNFVIVAAVKKLFYHL